MPRTRYHSRTGGVDAVTVTDQRLRKLGPEIVEFATPSAEPSKPDSKNAREGALAAVRRVHVLPRCLRAQASHNASGWRATHTQYSC